MKQESNRVNFSLLDNTVIRIKLTRIIEIRVFNALQTRFNSLLKRFQRVGYARKIRFYRVKREL